MMNALSGVDKEHLGVGVIGLSSRGGWASVSHAPAVTCLPGLELVGLVGSTPESSAISATEYGVSGFHTPEQLASHNDVNIVSVSVRVPEHFAALTPVLRTGKPVLCEWPLARNAHEARDLVEVAETSASKTFVGLQARSSPMLRAVRDAVTAGEIGEVMSTSIVASARRWGGSYHSRNEYLLDKENGATMFTIPFGHTLDALEMIMGELTAGVSIIDVRRDRVINKNTGLSRHMTSPDQVVLGGQFANGAVASMHFRGGLSRGTKFLWEINGTRGDIVIRGDTGQVQFGQYNVQIGTKPGNSELWDFNVPVEYKDSSLEALGGPASYAYGVGYHYGAIVEDIRTGHNTVPDFRHAARLHDKLADIDRISMTGEKATW